MWVGGEENDAKMDPQFLTGKTGCRENHLQREEGGGKNEQRCGEDHKGRFGQVEVEMLM